MHRRALLALLWVSLCCPAQAQEAASRGAGGSLASAIAEVTEQPRYQQAHWGILLVDQQTGEVVFEQNADKLFAPASVTKLYSVAAALDALGADFTFQTPIVRQGEINEQGELIGNLILVASGDLSLGGRTNAQGGIDFTNSDHTYAEGGSETELTTSDPLAGLNDLARHVANSGIKRVRGDVLVDDRLFEKGEGSGSGPGKLSSIMVNDNVIDFIIEPTQDGDPAKVSWRPESSAIHVVNEVETVASSEKPETTVRSLGGGRYVVQGKIPQGHKRLIHIKEVPDAAAYARTLLIEALARAGVSVDAPAVASASTSLPSRDEVKKMPQVAVYASPRFAESARLILKVSHNLHASTLPLLVASKHDGRTLAEGLRYQRDFLQRAGVDVKAISFAGGAGGARADCVTPRATVQLLRHMATRPDYEAYRYALPVLGVDGTLAKMVDANSPARGKVWAKTGTLYWHNTLNNGKLLQSKAMAGYQTTAKGRSLLFALFVNNVPLEDGITAKTVGRDLAKICEVVYERE